MSVYATIPARTDARRNRLTPQQIEDNRVCDKLRGRFNAARWKARDRGLTDDLTYEQWIGVVEASKGVCHYCQRLVGIEKIGMDHVIPVINGGPNTLSNIVACCFSCNARKCRKERPAEGVLTKWGDGETQQLDDKAIGAEMRRQRRESGVMLRVVAERLNLSTSYLCDLEYGKRTWNEARIQDYQRAIQGEAR